VNYYERHLGDYAKDARHLTMLEHGAYTLLMDRYYSTEKGIPADKAHRVAGARTPEEYAAVDAVLEEFFKLVDGVWVKGRIEEEIAKASVRIDAARENGKKGGRPRKEQPDPSINETQEKPSGFPVGNPDLTQVKAYQSPDTISKSEIETHATIAGECAKAMREAGCISINQSNPDFLAALDEGVTPKEFADAVNAVKGEVSGAGLFKYAVKVARTNHAKVAATLTTPTARAGPAQSQSKTMGAILALQGMKDGLDQTRTADRLSEAPHARLGASAGG
jgi:uncharacterized protein YdaU (DUF1376 family)